MKPKKILVVEDSPETAALVKFLLEKEGYETFIAADGKKGLELAKEIFPNLILIDIMLPEMDGYTLNMHLKEDQETAAIPVIVVTARGLLTQLFGSGDQDRIDGYLTKPFEPKELIALIKKVLERKKESA